MPSDSPALATALPSPTPTATPAPTERPETDPDDLARAQATVAKIIAYAENIGTDGSQISFTLASSSLDKMYALAYQEREWLRTARLSASQRDALSEAISAVDALKLVLDATEGDQEKAFILGFTILTYMPTWRSDLIGLE
jgi:hypothetical protein